jgi:hypothetical protein
MPTVEYAVPGASERKYMTDRVAFVKNDKSCWRKLHDVELAGFDWEWFPPTYEQPWIYTWGNQHHGSERMPTVEYHTPGATERKYMHDTVATLSDKMDNWVKLLPNVDFDWSWVPDPHDPPFIYVWGNQYYGVKLMPTLEYHVPGATERKYIHDTVATLTATETNWTKLLPNVDFDWSWIPHPHDPPYIYVWGNQYYDYTVMPTVEYSVPGATERKYMTDRHATLTQNREAYVELIPGADFDFSWIPDPREPAYIYVWGNQWHDAATEPTIEYHAPGATERKYMTDRVAVLPADYTNWSVSNFDDWNNFDFSWRPNPHSPPQIYQWADNGPRYTVPSATEVVLMTRQASNITSTVKRYYIETTLEDLIAQHTDEVFWALRSNIDYDSFNFNWRPDSSNFRHVNVFGNKLSADTQTYYINGPLYALGHRELNYINSLELSEHQDLAIEQRIILDMFYVELGTSGSEDRFAELKSRFPNIQKTRFLNSWRDTVLRCVRKAQTKFVWIVNSRTDYTDFQFDWYPADWQQNMLHVFGSQWSHWSNTYLVNAQTFERDTQYIEVIEHLSNINHVRGKTVPVVECVNDIVYIDMGNTGQLEQLQKVTKNVHVIPYVKSYLETLKSWLADNPNLKLKREYNVWITNSVSDYTDFDWSWYCDPFQRTQIHVFASGSHKNHQKFGDTLFVNLSEFSKFIDQLDQIENYSGKVNYIMHMPVPRLPHPVVNHDYDSHAQAFSDIGQHSWPYIELKTLEAPANSGPVPSVWGDMHDKILVGATGASQIIVPQSAFGVVRHEVYDYDRIETVVKPLVSAPLDIIFISNGEPIAEENYQHLVDVCQRKQIPNKIIRISNVDGRVASQHAAAAAAETRWYFLVNGKLRVKENFDWSWQPDRLQQPKHYIFTATNPVNGLEYGHQAIVANNRKLTLNTQPTGLDFTLSSLHESVEMNSGVALYNTDPWTTWRTAFRESIKLRSNTDDVSRYRLKIWTTLHDGEHGEWSVRGAQDGVAFWESVNGNLDELMQSYDWAWIREYYEGRYGK